MNVKQAKLVIWLSLKIALSITQLRALDEIFSLIQLLIDLSSLIKIIPVLEHLSLFLYVGKRDRMSCFHLFFKMGPPTVILQERAQRELSIDMAVCWTPTLKTSDKTTWGRHCKNETPILGDAISVLGVKPKQGGHVLW